MFTLNNLKLFQHQQQALTETEGRNKVAYYLDMGLGKTFVGSEKLWELNNKTNLVICQKSKVEDWKEHFTTYYPEYKVIDLTDNHKEAKIQADAMRINIENDSNVPCVLIINYELCFHRKWLKNMTDFTLMLDESSLINNEKAKRSKFILSLNPESVILLSGTPTAGKYEKLWSQLRLLGWNISRDTFWRSYVETEWIETDFFKREVVTGYKNVEHLKRKLAEHGAVFMKTEECYDLPEQVEQKIMLKPTSEYRKFHKTGYIEIMKKHQCCEYTQTDKDRNSDYYGNDVTETVELVGDNTLTKMLYERQLCGQYHKDKLDAMRNVMESTEDRLVVFYNFNEELAKLKNIASSLNRPVSIVCGHTKDLTAYENEDDSITFVQYQAGAMGLNLQKANKIVYFTLPLGKGSCDLWEQSKKRIHRIGQDRTCFYYYLLVRNSIEEKNLDMLRQGKDYTDELFKKQEDLK